MAETYNTIGEVPCWGPYNIRWNKKIIHVPSHLNSVGRYTRSSFWNWLTGIRYPQPFHSYITMTLEHIGEWETWQKTQTAQQQALAAQQDLASQQALTASPTSEDVVQ
jgi:hypothetical protein